MWKPDPYLGIMFKIEGPDNHHSELIGGTGYTAYLIKARYDGTFTLTARNDGKVRKITIKAEN
jgi:hypothetical protein